MVSRASMSVRVTATPSTVLTLPAHVPVSIPMGLAFADPLALVATVARRGLRRL
jgi:hypothetical protein